MSNLIQKALDSWAQLKQQYPQIASFTKWFLAIVVPVATAFFTGLLQAVFTWLSQTIFLGTLIVTPVDQTAAQMLEENNVLIKVTNVNANWDTLIHHGMKLSLARGTYRLELVDIRSKPPRLLAAELSSFTLNGMQIHTIQIIPRKTQNLQVSHRPEGFLKLIPSGEIGQRQILLKLIRVDSTSLERSIPPYVLELPKGSFKLELVLDGERISLPENLIQILPHDTVQVSVPFVTIQGRVTRASDIKERPFNLFQIQIGTRKSPIGEDGSFSLDGLTLSGCYEYTIFTVDGQRFKSGRIFNVQRKTEIKIPEPNGENITI
jgi:hypothetical protein